MLLGLSVKILQKAGTSSPPQGLTPTVLSQKLWSHVSHQRWCESGVQATRYMVTLFMVQGHTIHGAGSHYFMVQGHTISWCRVTLFHGTRSHCFMVHGHTVSWCMVTLFHGTWSHYFMVNVTHYFMVHGLSLIHI